MTTPGGEGRLRLLYELGCAFAARLELDDLLPLVVVKCRETLGAEGTAVSLRDPARPPRTRTCNFSRRWRRASRSRSRTRVSTRASRHQRKSYARRSGRCGVTSHVAIASPT